MEAELYELINRKANLPQKKRLISDWMSPARIIQLGEPLKLCLSEQMTDWIVCDQHGFLCGLLEPTSLLTYEPEQLMTKNMVSRANFVYVTDPLEQVNIPQRLLPVLDGHQRVVGQILPADFAKAFSYHLKKQEHTSQILDVILETAYEGVVVVDEQARVKHMNSNYKHFLGIERDEDVVGKHITEVVDNTRLHITVKTGLPERGEIQEIQRQNMVVHRIPIWKEDKLIGAIGMLLFEGVSELYHILDRVNDQSRLKVKSRQDSKQKRTTNQTFDRIIGHSKQLALTKSIARKAARTLATTLILGESGTGKELFAKAIHCSSPNADGPFISINCAAIPEQLLEAELFGYEDGAFSGARKGGNPGKFELAHKGTLFLDEIGDMPLTMQAKILRALQEREIERIGSAKKVAFDVRVLAATNRNLGEMIKDGQFREDLFYRLNIIEITVPPLRDRREDIPILLSHHIEQFCKRYNLELKQFSKEAIEALMAYHWPGNVREIVNMAERFVTLVEGKVIRLADLPQTLTKQREKPVFRQDAQAMERESLIKTLTEVGGNKTKAAKQLGIHRSTLYEKLKKYQLS